MKSPHTHKAYEFVREKIMEGIYPPGYRLQTVDLAAAIDVSRTPVRDALRQLEAEGLVTISPRLGASVRSLTGNEFKEMCEVRLGLESLAAELAAINRGPENLLDIQEAVEAMDAAIKKVDKKPGSRAIVTEQIRQDLRFHLAVIKAARNSFLEAEIRRLHLINRVVWMSASKEMQLNAKAVRNFQPRRHFVQETHRKIFLAIRAQEPDAARKLMHGHIADIIAHRIKAMIRLEKKRDMHRLSAEDAPYTYDSNR